MELETVRSDVISELEKCIDKFQSDDDVTELFITFLSKVAEEMDNPMVLHYLIDLIKNLCKLKLEASDLNFLMNVIYELGPSVTKNEVKDALGWIGNKIINLKKHIDPELRKCVRISRISPEAAHKFREIYLISKFSTNPMNDSKYAKEFNRYITRLCANLMGMTVSVEDLPSEMVGKFEDAYFSEILHNVKQRYVNFYISTISQILFPQENPDPRFVEELNNFVHISGDSSFQKLKFIVEKMGDIPNNMAISEDIPRVFSRFLNDVNSISHFPEFRNTTNEFIDGMITHIVEENLPLMTDVVTPATQLKMMIEQTPQHFLGMPDMEKEYEGEKFNLRTLRKLEPIPQPVEIRANRKTYPRLKTSQSKRRERIFPAVIGEPKETGHGTRLLVNINETENPGWTGNKHPYVVDPTGQYFECGMKCKNSRNVNDNKSIRASCLEQIERRRNSGESIHSRLSGGLVHCNNIINKQTMFHPGVSSPRSRSRSRSRRKLRSRVREFNVAASEFVPFANRQRQRPVEIEEGEIYEEPQREGSNKRRRRFSKYRRRRKRKTKKSRRRIRSKKRSKRCSHLRTSRFR